MKNMPMLISQKIFCRIKASYFYRNKSKTKSDTVTSFSFIPIHFWLNLINENCFSAFVSIFKVKHCEIHNLDYCVCKRFTL